MKRTAVAAAWLIGATVPLVASVVLLFGCCVLPFHGVIHKVLPFCHLATGILHPHQEQQSSPAHQRQEPVKRIATEMPRAFRTPLPAISWRFAPADAIGYRSFISLGAARCDDDIGLHLLVVTFLI